MTHDYRQLNKFIRKRFGTKKKYAEFLGISKVALSYKLSDKQSFTEEQISKTQKAFNLTIVQVYAFFHTEAYDSKEDIKEKGGTEDGKETIHS